MLFKNRKEYVLKLLKEKSFVTVNELSNDLKQSEVTIRKLLSQMENEGLLERNWGGAVNISSSLVEYSNEEKSIKNIDAKKEIAHEAYNMIYDGEAIFLDSGTTTLQLAKLIASGEKKNLLVCTNALNIGLELSKNENLHVIIVGGELRNRILSCTGPIALGSLSQLHFDKCFVTGNHFTVEMGFTTPVPSESDFKASVLKASKKTFVLMDYSKYGDNSLALICPISDVDYMITDSRCPSSLKQEFENKGCKLIISQEL